MYWNFRIMTLSLIYNGSKPQRRKSKLHVKKRVTIRKWEKKKNEHN